MDEHTAKDAARYRWLREHFRPKFHRCTNDYWILDGECATPVPVITGEADLTLDSAIDAAMETT